MVDGYNLALGVTVVGGRYTPGVPAEFNCRGPLIKPFPPENCPMELRVYGDQVGRTSLLRTYQPIGECSLTSDVMAFSADPGHECACHVDQRQVGGDFALLRHAP